MKVTKVYPDVGPWGSSAIVCELEDGRIYIPYFNDAASDMCCRDAEWPRDKDWIVESYSHWAGTTDEEVVERAFRTYGCPCEACKIEQDPGIIYTTSCQCIKERRETRRSSNDKMDSR